MRGGSFVLEGTPENLARHADFEAAYFGFPAAEGARA
jgi:hypothetical protein